MRIKHLRFGQEFSVAIQNKRSQAATMVVAPNDYEGGPQNKHNGADQWLFVVSGRGEAIVKRKRHILRKGTLILIERGETHEIRNLGSTPLKTLNFYLPLAYTKAGDALPAGKPGE